MLGLGSDMVGCGGYATGGGEVFPIARVLSAGLVLRVLECGDCLFDFFY